MPDGVVQRKTYSTQVADTIRQRILTGVFKAGEQLRQEHIAAEMGVSRIPVREALHQLHSEGFVTLVSHKGAVVSEVSLDDILELYELRARIETWLLALAIPNMVENDFIRIQEGVDRFGAAVENPQDSGGANWAFHNALYAPSGRRTSIEMVGKLHQKIEGYTRMMVLLPDANAKAHREHQKLLDLSCAGNAEAAVKLLAPHIEQGSKILVKRLKELRDDGRKQD